MSAKSVKDGQHFPHKTGEVVLVKWRDGKIYFAKIKTIEWSKKRCVVIFDDKSQDLARFSWIHDVNETTTDIICVKCKQDSSDKGNEIVLCDQCGYGYHQKCHETKILQRALEDDSSWICYFCEQEMACPYVANADALTQSLEDIDEHGNRPDKFKKKRKQSLKISMEPSKKYCTGLLADSPTVEQSGEEEAIGEHYMEQSGPISAKPHKTQSKRKSKPYKVEICSSISKEYFVDNDEDDLSSETPTPRSRKIKRKTPQSLESAGIATKKFCSDSPNMTESPSGVGIFSFEMPTEFHSNLHQLAMASQLVSQSPSGEVPNSVIKAIEHEQSKHDHHKSPNRENGINREKPKSLVLSIPRSPLISISGKQSTTTTPGSSLVRQSVLESATPSCFTTTAITSVPPTTTATIAAVTVSTTVATAIPSPVIVSNRNNKTTSPLETAIVASSTTPARRAVPGSPDSEESVFTYSNSTISNNDVVVISQSKPTTTSPAIVRIDSGESNVVLTSSTHPVTSIETVPKAVAKASEPMVILATSSNKVPTETTPSSAHPMVTTPVKVTQNGAFFECPPPVAMATKPTSIQFIDKTNVRMPKFMSPVTTPVVTMPTAADSSPVIIDNPSTSMIRATPTPGTPAGQPVYYVQITGGTPSQPVLVRPIRQPQAQSPIIKMVDGPSLSRTSSPVLSRTQSGGNHGDQQANHVNGTKTHKPNDSAKDGRTMYFANQMKDVGTNISVKMGATYNMVSEYTLISKFEEAWNKLNELAAQWQQPKQTPVSKKPPVTKVTVQQSPTVQSGRDKVVMVAQQQPQQIIQQIPQQRIPQQTLQHQRLTTPVQLVPISTPHHVTTPIVHGDVVSVLPSPAHVISTPPHVISTPGHVISTPGHVISNPVVIPAVARTGSDNVTYYSVPPNANINSATRAIHPHTHKNKDEVYMVQVKPVAPVMPVTPVMSARSGEKRTPQQCDVCSKKASFLCSGCQSAWYCGRTCQYNAWQEHSHRCHKRS